MPIPVYSRLGDLPGHRVGLIGSHSSNVSHYGVVPASFNDRVNVSETRPRLTEKGLEIVGFRDGGMHRMIGGLTAASQKDHVPVEMSRRGTQQIVETFARQME